MFKLCVHAGLMCMCGYYYMLAIYNITLSKYFPTLNTKYQIHVGAYVFGYYNKLFTNSDCHSFEKLCNVPK